MEQKSIQIFEMLVVLMAALIAYWQHRQKTQAVEENEESLVEISSPKMKRMNHLIGDIQPICVGKRRSKSVKIHRFVIKRSSKNLYSRRGLLFPKNKKFKFFKCLFALHYNKGEYVKNGKKISYFAQKIT